MEEKKFAQLSKETISLYAESVDEGGISESVASLLAEDVSYRIRELTQYSSQHMKHAKRRKIATEDFLKALKWANLEPVYGHSSAVGKDFQMVNHEDDDLFFNEDPLINIESVCDDDDSEDSIYPPVEKVETTVNCVWPAAEEPTTQVKKSPSSKQSSLHQNYFQLLTKSLLSDDTPQLQIAAFQDLSSNTKIRVIFPRLVDFIKKSVPIVRSDVSKSTRVLLICETLFKNDSVYFGRGVMALIECLHQWLVDPIDRGCENHWIIRHHIASVLSAILGRMRTHLNDTINRLQVEYQDILKDRTKPATSRYGALLGLTLAGTKTVVKPVLNLLNLTLHTTTGSTEYQHFLHLLKIVCVNLFHSYSSDAAGFIANSGGLDLKSYHLHVSECFGDSILPCTTQLAYHLCPRLNLTTPDISENECINDNGLIDIFPGNNRLNNNATSNEMSKPRLSGSHSTNAVPLMPRRRTTTLKVSRRSPISPLSLICNRLAISFSITTRIQQIVSSRDELNQNSESKFASLSGRMKHYGRKLQYTKSDSKHILSICDII